MNRNTCNDTGKKKETSVHRYHLCLRKTCRNREASNTHKNERVYDGVLKHMPDSIMESCNNYVVDESLEAIDLVVKARDKSLDIANDNSGQSFDKRNLG